MVPAGLVAALVLRILLLGAELSSREGRKMVQSWPGRGELRIGDSSYRWRDAQAAHSLARWFVIQY